MNQRHPIPGHHDQGPKPRYVLVWILAGFVVYVLLALLIKACGG